MDINPTNCWNFVEAPPFYSVTTYEKTVEYNGGPLKYHEIDVSKYQNTVIVLIAPNDFDDNNDYGVVLKYNPDYITGSACDIVVSKGNDLVYGCILYEDKDGNLHKMESQYLGMSPNENYVFNPGEAIRCTLFIDQWSDKYYWQMSEMIYREW